MKVWNAVMLVGTVLLAAPVVQAQDHGHLDASAAGKNQGDKLTWHNGADFVLESGYVKTMLPSTVAKTLGFYDGGFTFTARHMTNALGEVQASAAPGSFLVAEIVSVDGPEGGSFGFWETTAAAGTPTFALPVGAVPSGARFELSNANLGAGMPEGDPFGHIHGRRWTTTKPGIYTVGFRAIDTSVNGADGGPIHTPSDVIKIRYQAGYNIKEVTRENGVATITVGTATGFQFQLQKSASLGDSADWKNVDGAVVTGNDLFQPLVDEEATDDVRFYRVEVTAAP